jgi:hypothetical protein
MRQRLTVNSQRSTANSAICLIAALQLILSSSLFSQSVSASLDRDKILLGEQATLQFSLNNLAESNSFVATWPQLNDTLNHTEILKRSTIDTINVSGINAYNQSFTITSFDSGRWQLGPFNFVIQDKISGKQVRLATAPVYLSVLPIDVSSMQNYHPIKDIIDVQTSFNWMPVVISAAVLLLAIIIFIIIKKRKKKIISPSKIVLKGTPLERAIEKLRALEKEPLTSITPIKKFHSEIDLITRRYFEEVMHIKALQLTATELFAGINVYMQDAQLRSKFQQLFELNASVKFAKYMPQQEESKNTLKEIIKNLYEVDESVSYIRNNADRMVSKY